MGCTSSHSKPDIKRSHHSELKTVSSPAEADYYNENNDRNSSVLREYLGEDYYDPRASIIIDERYREERDEPNAARFQASKSGNNKTVKETLRSTVQNNNNETIVAMKSTQYLQPHDSAPNSARDTFSMNDQSGGSNNNKGQNYAYHSPLLGSGTVLGQGTGEVARTVSTDTLECDLTPRKSNTKRPQLYTNISESKVYIPSQDGITTTPRGQNSGTVLETVEESTEFNDKVCIHLLI